MISVIVCSRQPSSWLLHENHVKLTIGTSCEYIRIDNTNNKFPSLCAAYNEGIQRAKGDILVFMHEDASLETRDWGKVVEKKLKDETIGLLGLCGTQHFFADNYEWVAADRPYLKGWIVHPQMLIARALPEVSNQLPDNAFLMMKFDQTNKDFDVVALDGVFLAARREIFDKIEWDDQTFDDFHFYDMDISMQIRHRGYRIVSTTDIFLIHYTGGVYIKDTISKYGQRFLEKWKAHLPASCADTVPACQCERPWVTFAVFNSSLW